VRIRDSAGGFGRYHFRLSWEAGPVGGDMRRDDGGGRRDGGGDMRRDEPDRRGPEGFAWNNVVNFRGRGRGESRFNDRGGERLSDVNVDVDRGAKIVVSFRTDRGRPLLLTGTVIGRDGPRLRADMTTEDRRLRGIMMLSVDDRQNVNSITMDATDGRDRLRVTWDRR
jgi:hypothetical protein